MSRWWLQTFFISRLFGEDFEFDQYFSDGLKPPTRCSKQNSPNKNMVFLMICSLICQKEAKHQHVSSAKIFPPHHRSSFWILIILHRWKRNQMFICGRFLVANPNLNLYLPLLGGGVDKITTMKMGNPDVRKKSLATLGLLTLS